MKIEELLKNLPPIKGLEKDFLLHEGIGLEINPCGDKINRKKVYKILTKKSIC